MYDPAPPRIGRCIRTFWKRESRPLPKSSGPKEKKFSRGDVARAQGDGLMFDALWTFQISDDAE
jgi:hypothetical protein